MDITDQLNSDISVSFDFPTDEEINNTVDKIVGALFEKKEDENLSELDKIIAVLEPYDKYGIFEKEENRTLYAALKFFNHLINSDTLSEKEENELDENFLNTSAKYIYKTMFTHKDFEYKDDYIDTGLLQNIALELGL